MTVELWQRIKVVLEELEGLAENARAPVLERISRGDPDLWREVQPFLSDGDGAFIREAISEQAANLSEVKARQERFGHYRLVRRIGVGGMGAVYEAVRVDDFHKKVALKIIKQGLDSDYARTRFLQERQLVATLEHPYITRLLDGGETDDGSPYLVLEFVDGQPITDYCQALDRTQRLRLFLKVCEAVEHAHRNLVVHRDLKPANILVTANGDPKLLDFGIAKLLEPGSVKTQTGFAALTPDYASPEQVRGETITTASDVYSLGVILYQLLTGRQPYMLGSATLLEMDRVICLQAPEPPGLGDELDFILLMALRKEPVRRYGSVQQFAQDIERYLDHRPVAARPDTVRYRAQKFVRRNWWQLASVALVILSLSIGLGFTLMEQRRTNRRFNQVRQLANRFLFDFHDQIVNTPGTVKAREMIVSTALEYLSSLSADATGDPGLQWELAVAYTKVAAVQGSMTQPSLRRPADAMASYEKALLLARGLAKANQLNVKQRTILVDMLCDAEGARRYLRQYDSATALGKEAVEMSAGLEANARRRALNELALTLGQTGDLLGSVNALERMVPIARETALRDPSLKSKRGLASTLMNLSNAQFSLTRFSDAATSASESVALYRALAAENPSDITLVRRIFLGLIALAQIEGAGDRPSREHPVEAARLYEEALQILNPILAADPADRSSRNDSGLVHDQIAFTLRDAAPREAIQHALIAAKFLDAASSDNSEYRAQPRIAAADAYIKLGQLEEAERSLKESERILSKRGTDTEADLDLSWARMEIARDNNEGASVRFAQAIALYEKAWSKSATPATAWALTRALEFAAQGSSATAQALRQRILAVWTDMDVRFPGQPYIQHRLAEAHK